MKVIEIRTRWGETDQPAVPLKTIHITCPNLKALRYRSKAITLENHQTETEYVNNSKAIPNMTHLTTLDIEIKSITTAYLEQLLDVSPHLSHLSLILEDWEI